MEIHWNRYRNRKCQKNDVNEEEKKDVQHE